MNDIEKIDLKIEILKDIKDCLAFDFVIMGEKLSLDLLDKKIKKLESENTIL